MKILKCRKIFKKQFTTSMSWYYIIYYTIAVFLYSHGKYYFNGWFYNEVSYLVLFSTRSYQLNKSEFN